MNSPTCTEAWVAVVADSATAQGLLSSLQSAGVAALRFDACTDLMHCSNANAPLAVVLGLPPMEAHGTACAPEPTGRWDVPVIAVGPPAGADALVLASQWAECGAHHWQASLAPSDWALALAFARATHQRDQAQRQRIASLQDELAEQRLVSRAKGLLMAAQGMTENEAFALLRTGAMQTRLPMADMARAVVDAAIWAEAINRAGQLRWLSQRCIAAAAQRLARIDAPAARSMQHEALKRARDILDGLHRLPLPDTALDALRETDAAWQRLKASLNARLELASLRAADASAEQALERAEVLASSLQAVGSSPMLRVVNLCGRQRMRAQRLVKLGLLARLGLASADAEVANAADASALMQSFSDTLEELANLPLGSSEIAAAHQRAVDRWRDMARALQAGEATELVRCGEALLVSVDELTHCWERSLQLLLG